MPITTDTVALTFLLFCRIGACLMLMPGFSSARVPVQVRLFVAIAVTLALAPVILPGVKVDPARLAQGTFLWLVVAESFLGAVIGASGRMFFLALQFAAVAAANFLAVGSLPGTPIEDNEPVPAVAALITVTATMQFFVTEQHWEVLRALVGIYTLLPISDLVPVEAGLDKVTRALADAFALTLQLTSPFLVYGLIINVVFGVANKLTPQVPVYFISMPFVFAGGVLLLYFTVGEVIRLFIAAFANWLTRL